MNKYQEIKHLVENVSKIVITSHKSPDGDSIGSSLGLYLVLKSLGKDVVVCHPDPAPDYLHWVPFVDEIQNWEEDKEKVVTLMNEAELIFSLDYNEPGRMGEDMGNALRGTHAKKIMIDHHLHPENYVDVMLSDTTSCSTCQLVYDVVDKAGWTEFLSADAGICLYLGIMTDSGSFRFPSVLPHTHEVVSKLLKLDINRLKGYACAEKLVVNEEFKIAYIWLTQDELKRFNHQKGDTEGLVNTALSILGMKVAILFTESDGYVKISFRSKGGDNPVNVLASSHFNGGGHANASGGRFDGKIEDAIKLFFEVAPQFFLN
jgi:phosphoesterase RecJ-like protein